MIRQLLNRAARKSPAGEASNVPAEGERDQAHVFSTKLALAFTAALRGLDGHATARQELVAAGVTAQRVAALYDSAFTTALSNLVPLVQKEDLLRVLISNTKRQQVVYTTNELLRATLGPAVRTSEWLTNQPLPGGMGPTAEAERAIDALLGPAYAGHGVGHWFTTVLWHTWWLGELRPQMTEVQRERADAETCWVAWNLVPHLTLRLANGH